MIMEGKLKLVTKEASNDYESSHFYSYIMYFESRPLTSHSHLKSLINNGSKATENHM